MYLRAQRCEMTQNTHPCSHSVKCLWLPLQSHPPQWPQQWQRDARVETDKHPSLCLFKAQSASQQTGKRGRASCEWGLIPSLRWPHFRVETQAPNLLFTHSNMFTAVGRRNCQRHSQGLEKHPWGSARLAFVRSIASEWNSKHFRPVSASSTRIAVSRAAQEGDYTTHSLWLYQRNKLRGWCAEATQT